MAVSLSLSLLLKKMTFSKSLMASLKDFTRKIHNKYLGRIEIIIIIALVGYIIGLTIFLIVLW